MFPVVEHAAADDDDDEQQSKTPPLSRKLKAISLDSAARLSAPRDVFLSVPNTPKKVARCAMRDNDGDAASLRRFASNTSISSCSQLKPLPEIMTLHDFGVEAAPLRGVRAKGLLERRGSNASLTIDLGGATSDRRAAAGGGENPLTAKSSSTLSLTSFGTCCTSFYQNVYNKRGDSIACPKCTIYESQQQQPPPPPTCQLRHRNSIISSARKSLSNENLYVPPCSLCARSAAAAADDAATWWRGARRACYPRQSGVEAMHAQLSDDFRLQLQNVQYLQTAGHLLSVAELRSCCELPRVPQLHQEFWEVPLNLQEKCIVSGSQSRNRYRGILPNEHSRVHLLENVQSYIHANYVKGGDYTETAYVATQGPMAHTCVDFWHMLWQTRAENIVMLTQLVEKRRNKCELYFPLGRLHNASHLIIRAGGADDMEETLMEFERVDEVQFGTFRITFGALDADAAECSVRTLHVENVRTREVRTLRHFWYANWQDHKMTDAAEVLRLALRVLAACRRPPLVVHCSAGIGRTGCFLAILNGIEQLRRSGSVDVLAIVCALRLCRGGMVQTAEQYELIHRVLALYAEQTVLPTTTTD